MHHLSPVAGATRVLVGGAASPARTGGSARRRRRAPWASGAVLALVLAPFLAAAAPAAGPPPFGLRLTGVPEGVPPSASDDVVQVCLVPGVYHCASAEATVLKANCVFLAWGGYRGTMCDIWAFGSYAAWGWETGKMEVRSELCAMENGECLDVVCWDPDTATLPTPALSTFTMSNECGYQFWVREPDGSPGRDGCLDWGALARTVAGWGFVDTQDPRGLLPQGVTNATATDGYHTVTHCWDDAL